VKLSYGSEEYMFDVIGVGATANAFIDWHNVWQISPVAAILEVLGRIHAEGRSRPVVQTELCTQFATLWNHQTIALIQRNFQAYWRNPTYLMAKLVLNIAGSLLIGFTFFQTKYSLQGSQNKLFV
jgi:ATP-binding cassette subfamily G (WHITE) protein 2 (SNQ2)